MVVPFYISNSSIWEMGWSTSSIILGIWVFFILARMMSLVISHCGFNLYVLMTKETEHFFIFLLAISISSFVKCLCKTFVHNSIGMSLLFLIVRVFYISKYKFWWASPNLWVIYLLSYWGFLKNTFLKF